MKIRVLGCSGAIAQHARTTSFLLDEHILLDAGTGVADLPLGQMVRIDHVLLTHSHLDHIAALPLMLDAVAGLRSQPLRVHALPETIAALRTHVFNGVIWPDFSVIPSPQQPMVEFHPIEIGQVLTLNGQRIEVLPACHTVPAVGFAVSTPQGYWVFTGDTERNPLFWERLRQLPLAMLVIELTFSERSSALAHVSAHLCPQVLAEELTLLQAPLQPGWRLGLTHTKPLEEALLRSEIQALGLAQQYPLFWLKTGQVFEF